MLGRPQWAAGCHGNAFYSQRDVGERPRGPGGAHGGDDRGPLPREGNTWDQACQSPGPNRLLTSELLPLDRGQRHGER